MLSVQHAPRFPQHPHTKYNLQRATCTRHFITRNAHRTPRNPRPYA